MKKLRIFDPPMCCSTGVCGPSVDPALPQFAADLEWLARAGVEVGRYNLAQQPQAFAADATVKAALEQFGTGCLPLFLVGEAIVHRGSYPSREFLCTILGVTAPESSGAGSASSTSKRRSGSCCR